MTTKAGGWAAADAKESRMWHAARQLVDIVRYCRTDGMELNLGVLGLIWGAVMLNPLAAAFASTPSYATMARLAPEWAWGLGALLVGVGALAALLFDGARWRRIAMFAGLAYWLFVASTFALGNIDSAGWVVYGLIACYHGHAFLRLGAPRR
jgi:Na+-driven multidrug efflux pump